MTVTVECAGVARASGRHSSRAIAGIPELTTMRLCFGDENSNDRQPACASRLDSIGGAPPVSMIRTAPLASIR